MDPSDLERLELKLAYLERANTELSDVVYEQQRELERLRAQLQRLVERLEDLTSSGMPYTSEEERPPHY